MKTLKNEESLDEGQPLVEHLIELRARLLKIIGFVFLIFLPLLFFANDIYDLISKPLRNLMPPGSSMIATEVASPFLTPFKLAFVTSFFISIPFILHQTWSFDKHLFILFRNGFCLLRGFPVSFWFLCFGHPGGCKHDDRYKPLFRFCTKTFFRFLTGIWNSDSNDDFSLVRRDHHGGYQK